MFADTNGDAIVESSDITAVLNNWGNTVDPNYYYSWGYEQQGPDCLNPLSTDDQLRENYAQIYNSITDSCPCDLTEQVAIEYLADLLDFNHNIDYYGCTDYSASNYSPNATLDNGTCQYSPIPSKFKVHQNFPNPFNPSTRFPVDVDVRSDVTLRVYDLSGAVVYEQSVDSMEPGSYHSSSPFIWHSLYNSSGIYFYSFMTSRGESAFKKLTLIK